MPRMRQSNVKRRRQLVGHVARYQITTAGAVAGDMALPIETIPAAKGCLTELVKSGVLGHAPLYRRRNYYYLTPHGVDSLKTLAGPEAKPPASGPLSEPAKIRAYAMLAFCCLCRQQRVRLTREQFEHDMPNLYRPGMPLNYYMARGSCGMRLGFLRVDAGGVGRWDRIVSKVRHDIESHWRRRGFRALIQNERFEIAVATTTPAKCERLRQALADDQKLRPVPLRIVAIPEQIHLLAPPATTPTTRAQP